ncbi:MAG: hypothetical protein RQ875_11105 [Vicingaceae bacterium]|nr:hypothetical protein [Vicingaceae bacterium]
MKNIILIFGLLFTVIHVNAQAPEKINYQAVARDLSGNPLVNQTLNVTYEIRQSSPTGTSVYTETHTGISTNQFGLFTAEIGGGTPSTGTFAGINWGAGLHYLYVEVNGDPMGSSQLLSVPYALYSKQSANGPQGLPGNNSISIVTTEPPGTNCPGGGNKIDVGTDDNGDNILQPLEIDFTYYVCHGDSTSASGDDWGNQVVITQGGNIQGDGTTTNPLSVFDNDTSATNEIQDLSISGNTIGITSGIGINLSPTAPVTGQVLTWNGTAWIAQNATSGGDNWGSQVVISDATLNGSGIAGNPLSVNGVLTDNQDLTLTGNTLSLTNDPTPVDLSPYLDNTDAQTLSINANNLSISNGNTISLPQAPNYSAGTGISITGTQPNLTINNTSPASGINITGAGLTTVTGTSPTFTVNTPAQTLTYAAPNLTLSNGGGTVTLPTSPWAKTGTTLHPAIAGDNVGIGTNTSTNKLQIHTTTNGVKNLHLTSASTGTTNTDGFEISNDASTTLNMWQKENADWNFNTSSSGSIAISIKPNTNVGIGTSTAMNRLTVAGGASIGGAYVSNSAPANGLLVQGNVGIGTTSPLAKFHVEQNTSAVMMLKEVTPTNGAAFVMESLNQYVLLSNESGTFRIENATNTLQPFNINSTGEVGIGGDAFHSALDVYGRITMRNGATTGYVPVSDANGTMTWTDPNTLITTTPSLWNQTGANIYNNNTGNVGIGTNNPNAQLEVIRGTLGNIQLFNNANLTYPLLINAAGTGGKFIGFNYNSISVDFGSNGSSGLIGTNSNHNLSFITNGNAAATINNVGNFGIGTTSPGIIPGATKYLTVSAGPSTNSGEASIELQGGQSTVGNSVGNISFVSNFGSSPFQLDIAKIDARIDAGAQFRGALVFYTANGTMASTATNQERMRINAAGNVGIGTTTPSQKLDVNGTINISSNTGEVNNSAKTGAANLVPIAYGNVTATGTINTGTGNFSITNSATGSYLITVAGETLNLSNCIIHITTQNSNPRFVGYGASGGSLFVYIRDNTSAFVNNNFSFIIYRP